MKFAPPPILHPHLSPPPQTLFLRGWRIDCCVCCCFLRSPSSLVMAPSPLRLALAGRRSRAVWDFCSSQASSDPTAVTARVLICSILVCFFVLLYSGISALFDIGSRERGKAVEREGGTYSRGPGPQQEGLDSWHLHH